MDSIKNIASGWFNVVKDKLGILKPEVKIKAENRLKICSTCPQRKGDSCGVCGCPLIAKCRSMESNCPIGRWT